MKQQKMLNTNKGITLIALVITIIVMLILVAVTISMAVNGGLFEYAGKAIGDTNNAIREEQQLASGKVTIDNIVYNSIDEYLETKSGSGNAGNNAGEDIQGIDGEVFTAIYTETKEYKDKNNDTAVIPKGFSVGKSDGINTIDEGLVIQDVEGNQFVWIPVEYTASGTTDEYGLDSGFLEVFKRSNADDTIYSEPYVDGYEEEVTEYYEMMLGVQKNKGFYIGRFEAGTEEGRYEGVANGTDTLVIKRDAYPYNCVAWGKTMSDYENIIKYDFSKWRDDDETGLDQGHGAVYLSRHLLDGQEVEATSTLCYGVQWDVMLKFLGKDEERNSTEWGNYYNNDYTITRQTAKYSDDDGKTWTQVTGEGKSKSNNEELLLTTGASEDFEVKNIYDIAGNQFEWTMEATSAVSASTIYRSLRGGHYCSGGRDSNASFRTYSRPYNCNNDDSFRVALYIK